MPTYERLSRFQRDFGSLTPDQQRALLIAARLFVQSLRTGQFDPRLRVKRVRGHEDIWELTWAPDGRATFTYVRPGDPHIIWRRVGTHDIFREP